VRSSSFSKSSSVPIRCRRVKELAVEMVLGRIDAGGPYWGDSVADFDGSTMHRLRGRYSRSRDKRHNKLRDLPSRLTFGSMPGYTAPMPIQQRSAS
jgi:hypothetical protein